MKATAHPSLEDYQVETIPLSTRFEAGRAWAKSLEQVTKSLMDFFPEVSCTRELFLCSYLLSHSDHFMLVIVGDREHLDSRLAAFIVDGQEVVKWEN